MLAPALTSLSTKAHPSRRRRFHLQSSASDSTSCIVCSLPRQPSCPATSAGQGSGTHIPGLLVCQDPAGSCLSPRLRKPPAWWMTRSPPAAALPAWPSLAARSRRRSAAVPARATCTPSPDPAAACRSAFRACVTRAAVKRLYRGTATASAHGTRTPRKEMHHWQHPHRVSCIFALKQKGTVGPALLLPMSSNSQGPDRCQRAPSSPPACRPRTPAGGCARGWRR